MRSVQIGSAFACYLSQGFYWFRLFGHGLHFKNLAFHRMTFSERYGYVRKLQIGKWLIRRLSP